MATKKITELPFIVTVSGSSVFDNPSVNSVVPVVLYGTTNQITVENFSKFTNLYAAQTGSQNIFTQNQWFNAIVSASTINVGTLGVGGNTTIAGTLGVTGNGTIGGNLAVAGRITAEEFYTEITTASVIYASGSTKFGDDTGDKHEFTGSINVSGSVIYNGVILTNIDANTIQRLQQATASIQQATASLNTFTASQDGRNFTLSQVTGSFAGEIGGLEAYTASLKTAAIVSSSTQILNYNVFAVTSSGNTFYGNQSITGSLSVGRGQFNVVTGSGGLTSSLTFTHNITSPGDGNAILELRHNNRIYNDDIAIKLKADFAGAYLDYEEDTVPYSILSVQSFANKNVYIHQDTRLLFSNLTVDDNLVVKQDTRMTGSLFVMGVITGSILATNGVISSSNQLFELNQFTASQDSRNFTLSQVTGSFNYFYQATASIQFQTASLLQFTASQDSRNFTLSQVTGSFNYFYQATASLQTFTASQADRNLVLSIVTGSINQATASIQLQTASLLAFTASQDSRNLTLSTVTGSLIGITNGLMAFTAALDSTYATDAQLYQLYQATRSIELTTGSLIGITNGLMAFTASLDNTFATDAQLYQLYQSTRSIELTTGSLIGITNGLMAFTAALDSTYATDAQLYQLYAETASIKAEIGGIELYTASLKAASIVSSSTQVQNYDVFALNSNLYNGTGSIKGEIAGIEAYTASLKGAAIVSSSQQITNYYKFAETASANTTFYGGVTANSGLINGTTDAFFDLNRSASGNASRVRFQTVGTDEFEIGLKGGVPGFHITKGDATELVTVLSDGGVDFVGSPTASIFKIKTAGGGIDFSITSNGSGTTTSELLNDYEEGTFTPVLKGSTTAGTYTYDTDRTNGKYIKIGNQVNLIGVLRVDTVSSAGTGNALIGGIPFAPTAIDINWSRVPGILSVQSGPTLPSASLLVYTQSETYSDAIGMGYNGMEGWNQLDVTLADIPLAMWFFNITYHTI